MPLSYKIEDGIVYLTVTGKVGIHEHNAFTETWSSDPDLPDPVRILRDSRNELDVSSSDVRQRIGFAETMPLPDQFRVAILVDREVTYGMSRMYQSLRPEELESKMEMKIFRNLDEAREWLMQPSLEEETSG